LRKIGWEEERILELQDKLLNGEVESKEKIFATLEAETNAALSALLTYAGEQSEYTSLTNGASLHVKAEVDEITPSPADLPVVAETAGAVVVNPGHDKVNLRATIDETVSGEGLLDANGQITLPAAIKIANSGTNDEQLPQELQTILDQYGAIAIDGVVQWSEDLINAGLMSPEGLLDFEAIESALGPEVRKAFETNFSNGSYFSIPAALNFVSENSEKFLNGTDDEGNKVFDIKGMMEIMSLYGANIELDDKNNPLFTVAARVLDEVDGLDELLAQKTFDVSPNLVGMEEF